MDRENAKKIIERIEGTLIKDLKSLKIIAEEREKEKTFYKKLSGGLNYTLFLIGLIASETLGFFISEDSAAGRSDENIRKFILSKFFKNSAYKKEKYLNILTSLRTNLAHVFGMTNLKLEDITTELGLCVGGIKKPDLKSDNTCVKLNGIKFVELVIDGFNSIKSEVLEKNGSSSIINTINKKANI